MNRQWAPSIELSLGFKKPDKKLGFEFRQVGAPPDP